MTGTDQMLAAVRRKFDSVTEEASSKRTAVDHGSEPPDNGRMEEQRLTEIEKAIIRLDSRAERVEADLDSLKADMVSVKSGIGELKVSFAAMGAKLDISAIRAKVESSHTDIYKWIATLLIGGITIAASIYFGLQRASEVNALRAPGGATTQQQLTPLQSKN